MSSFLSPKRIQETYLIGRTTAYKLLKEFEESGGEVIRIGRTPRVEEGNFTDFLKARSKEKQNGAKKSAF